MIELSCAKVLDEFYSSMRIWTKYLILTRTAVEASHISLGLEAEDSSNVHVAGDVQLRNGVINPKGFHCFADEDFMELY